MGIRITVKGADYSQWFGGNVDVDELYGNYLERMSSVGYNLSDAHKTALNTLLETLGNDLKYFRNLYLFLGSTAQSHSLGVMDRSDLVFGGDNAVFAENGFNSNGTSYADTAWKPTGNFAIGVFASQAIYSNNPSAFAGVVNTGRLVLTAKGNDAVLYGSLLRDGVVDATVRASIRPINTPSYLCVSDDGTTHSMFSSEEASILKKTHTPVNYSSITDNLYIGGFNSKGLVEPFNTTYKAFFISDYVNDEKMNNFIKAINTFLREIGR